MITPEEKQEIIDAAVEKALLLLPEVIGNLIQDHVAMSKINSDFYKQHPEFADHKQAVASVIEAIEGKNPLLDYKDLLNKAIPEIHERIRTVGSLNMTDVSSNPSRTYESLLVPKVDNVHGEL